MESLTDLFSQIAVGGVIAVIASWITVRLSLKRFISEKWWEKKVDAYAAILESIHYMKVTFEEDLNALEMAQEVPDDRKQETLKKHREARDELYKQIDVWQFVLSDKAVGAVSALNKNLENAGSDPPNDWHLYLDDSWAALDGSLKELRALAKADLKNG